MAGYKLATYQTPDGPRAGLVIDDRVFDAAKLTGKPAYATVLGILEGPLVTLLGSYGQSLDPTGLNVAFFVVLIGSGGALGIAGALVAARQRLTHLQIL